MKGTDWKDKEFTMKELCAEMPEIAAYETQENAKEGYQDIQKIFAQAYEKVCAPLSAFESWDPDSVKRVKESIRIACENRMLLREKYEDYIEEM